MSHKNQRASSSSEPLDPLSALAIRYGTDKYGYHLYTPFYHQILAHLRDQSLSMLEIGIGGYDDPYTGGESLMMWRDYFSKAQVIGMDVQPKTLDLGERIVTLEGSQSDIDLLTQIERSHGPFQVVVDDGSHRSADILTTFETLWPLLAPGGVYIIEDVQTAFFPDFGGSLNMAAPNTVGYFVDHFLSPQRSGVTAISRLHNLIVLYKGAHPYIARLEADAVPSHTTSFQEALSSLADEGCNAPIICMPDSAQRRSDAETMRRCFVDMDFSEIAVHHADYQPLAIVSRTRALTRSRAGWTVEFGANDYPSNHRFDFEHPLVVEVEAVIAEQIAQKQTPPAGLAAHAHWLMEKGDLESAAAVVDRLRSEAPTDFQTLKSHGQLLWLMHDLKGAVQVYQSACQCFPSVRFFWLRLELILNKLGRHSDAIDVQTRRLRTEC